MHKFAVLLAFVVACGGTDGPSEDPAFPADYKSTYQEVRNCRMSLEHDLHFIRVLASPEAVTPYMNRTDPFPVGSIVVKEEYNRSDTNCSGAIELFTVMQKLEPGTAPETLGWHWQQVSGGRSVQTSDEQRCINCHKACPTPPDGYDYTCTQP